MSYLTYEDAGWEDTKPGKQIIKDYKKFLAKYNLSAVDGVIVSDVLQSIILYKPVKKCKC